MSSLLMLLNALRIASSKVALSIVNIFIFRSIYSVAGKHVHGFYAFLITVFLVSKIKTYWSRLVDSLTANEANKFDSTRLTRVDVTDSGDFCEQANVSFHTDLFSYIFGSASQSALINLLVIIAIEKLCSSYEFSIYRAMFYCVGVAFFILFGSSFSYMSLLYEEWTEYYSSLKRDKTVVMVASTNRKHAVLYDHRDLVCLVDSTLKENEISIEFKYLSAKYMNHVSDLVDYYVKNHVNLPPTADDDENSTEPSPSFGFDYSFVVPDYYDQNFAVSSTLRKYKFRKVDSWTEFNMFVWVGMQKTVYNNAVSKSTDKKQKKQ